MKTYRNKFTLRFLAEEVVEMLFSVMKALLSMVDSLFSFLQMVVVVVTVVVRFEFTFLFLMLETVEMFFGVVQTLFGLVNVVLSLMQMMLLGIK